MKDIKNNANQSNDKSYLDKINTDYSNIKFKGETSWQKDPSGEDLIIEE